MPSDKGLKIVQQLLANAAITEKHASKPKMKKSVPPAAPQDPATLRYIRTPEHDGRFECGMTYRDSQTGRISWWPDEVDPNLV